ncbi:DUF5691 domain-containing protein [Streptomyces sp. HNM0574]|uniref:DUF5691 domain-containing protein n=1 Tax=Streptomyces sp. HNM0574 TaxID=2714954 RepID=UPI003216E0AE
MNASWSELVTSALLGAERRTPPGGSTTALLDAAAAETVRRRAGLRPAPAAPRPEPAAEDGRPPLPAAAEARLRALLAGRSGGTGAAGGRRGSAPDLAELLPQWLTLACAAGYRAPSDLVPALLDAARARTDLRQDALAFGGPLARWLARLNPDWKFALRGANRSSAPRCASSRDDNHASVHGQASVRELWQEGLFAERAALLTELRRRSPGEGRELLASTWPSERAEDRLMLLDTLREGLSPADEPFLEQALADRSRNVRATAAELLATLPGSALAARMADRATAHVTLAAAPDTAYLTVDAPQTCDAAMRRDGVVPTPPQGHGERSWWLGQLVAAAPLAVWPSRLGGRTPAQITALPVADGWARDLRAAWCRAAVRQRDAAWARALLGAPRDQPAEGPGDPAKLLTVLPEDERARWAGQFIEAHGLSDAFRLLGVCAVPWARPLGRAVVDALQIARDAGNYPWSFSGVMGLAERCLDPAETERLTPLAAVPEEPADGSPGAGAYWAEAFQRLVATLRLRAEIRTELGVPAAAG